MAFTCIKKEIVYRGGLVRFYIPKHWNEEYEKEGGGTFYEQGENTGTLRLNVLSFLTKENVSPEYPLLAMQSLKIKNNGQVEELTDGRFLLKYSIKCKEDGEDIIIFRWEVAKMVSPREYNIAAFSFTITAAQSKSPLILKEISSLEDEVKNVSFGIHNENYKL